MPIPAPSIPPAREGRSRKRIRRNEAQPHHTDQATRHTLGLPKTIAVCKAI